MSNMGQTIVQIQELYYFGIPSEEIAKTTRTTKSFVDGIIESLDETEMYDYPEPEGDF
jgi:hypothetical protein